MILRIGKGTYIWGCRTISLEDDEISRLARICASKLANYVYGEDDWLIIKGEYGKPYFPNNNYRLSISHTDDCIIVAVSDECEIGIDVEPIHSVSHFIMNKYYSDDEKEFIDSSQRKDMASTMIWTAKEAHSKCVGSGLVKENLYWCTRNAGDYQLYTFSIMNYIVTLCMDIS